MQGTGYMLKAGTSVLSEYHIQSTVLLLGMLSGSLPLLS